MARTAPVVESSSHVSSGFSSAARVGGDVARFSAFPPTSLSGPGVSLREIDESGRSSFGLQG